MSNSNAWIRDVVASLQGETDKEICRRAPEPCGRRCFPKSLGATAHAIWKGSPTVQAFLDRLHEAFDPVTIVGGEVRVVYPECYCEQIRGIPIGEIPHAYCNCSVGWVQELFRQATGREAEVRALTTIVRGGKECCFRVDLGMALDARPH